MPGTLLEFNRYSSSGQKLVLQFPLPRVHSGQPKPGRGCSETTGHPLIRRAHSPGSADLAEFLLMFKPPSWCVPGGRQSSRRTHAQPQSCLPGFRCLRFKQSPWTPVELIKCLESGKCSQSLPQWEFPRKEVFRDLFLAEAAKTWYCITPYSPMNSL